MKHLATLLTVLLLSAMASAQPIAAPGAKLRQLTGDCKFTEGPAVDGQGNVYFTDQPNDRIMLATTDGKVSEWLKPAGRSNGLFFDVNGNLLACADGKNELWSIDVKTKQHTVLLKDYQGKLFNGPNDLWVRPDGGIYFTDPYYKRNYWNRGPSEMKQCVYFLSPDRKTVTRVAEDLTQPNGVRGTTDGKTLYVADIGAKKTYSYAINADGSLADKKLFCEMGSDGMTLDAEGNLYLTGKGVTVFDKSGKKIDQIDVPEGWTANVCFAGTDGQTLYITASKSLYVLQTRVKGAYCSYAK